MAMDLTVDHYDTYDDLYEYVYGSAAVIGLQMLPILEPAHPEPLARAEALGVAFQLANFIRDVDEDLDRGRIYLPLAELERVRRLAGAILRQRRLTPADPRRAAVPDRTGAPSGALQPTRHRDAAPRRSRLHRHRPGARTAGSWMRWRTSTTTCSPTGRRSRCAADSRWRGPAQFGLRRPAGCGGPGTSRVTATSAAVGRCARTQQTDASAAGRHGFALHAAPAQPDPGGQRQQDQREPEQQVLHGGVGDAALAEERRAYPRPGVSSPTMASPS